MGYLYLVLIFSFTLPCISSKSIEECQNVCKTIFRCPEKLISCYYGCKNYQEIIGSSNTIESDSKCNQACKRRFTEGNSFSHPMPAEVIQEPCFVGCKIRSGVPLPPIPARVPFMLVKFDSDVSFDSPLKMFNRMLRRMGFSDSEEEKEMMSPMQTEDSLFAPPKLPSQLIAASGAKDAPVGKPVVQFWSADQVQIDSRGIRIRHRDSDHPETVETVIKAAQLPGAGGPAVDVPNIALPPPKDFLHEIPMPRGPPLNVEHKRGGDLEKRTGAIQEQQVGGTQVNIEAVDEAPLRGAESSDSWMACWHRFVERHRRCRHRWVAHLLFGLLFGLSTFFLCYHVARRRHRRHHHKHHGEKTEGHPTYVIALPPSYEELYSPEKKTLLGAEVVVAVTVPEGAKPTDEDKKPLLAP
jgi:hypothetical protein